MAIRTGLLFAAFLVLAACESRLNPFNWFGGPREERIDVAEQQAEPADPRPLIDQVIDLDLTRLPTGAVVSAIGLPPRQGFWEADLVERSREDGILILEFRVFEPPVQTRQGSQRSREVLAGTALSNQDLAQIRQIVVEGARNRLVASR
ncbi:hypothetical protein HKCCE3408_05185 [Rhodobacterales bacterium HKCCE3408]|nr:hypothetical protein [Rhodobacterales bacterium HKCCE3408]